MAHATGPASATVPERDGVADEYALGARRYLGEEVGDQYISHFDPAAIRMARIGVTPSWVTLIDFQTLLPSPLGGLAQ